MKRYQNDQRLEKIDETGASHMELINPGGDYVYITSMMFNGYEVIKRSMKGVYRGDKVVWSFNRTHDVGTEVRVIFNVLVFGGFIERIFFFTIEE